MFDRAPTGIVNVNVELPPRGLSILIETAPAR